MIILRNKNFSFLSNNKGLVTSTIGGAALGGYGASKLNKYLGKGDLGNIIIGSAIGACLGFLGHEKLEEFIDILKAKTSIVSYNDELGDFIKNLNNRMKPILEHQDYGFKPVPSSDGSIMYESPYFVIEVSSNRSGIEVEYRLITIDGADTTDCPCLSTSYTTEIGKDTLRRTILPNYSTVSIPNSSREKLVHSVKEFKNVFISDLITFKNGIKDSLKELIEEPYVESYYKVLPKVYQTIDKCINIVKQC